MFYSATEQTAAYRTSAHSTGDGLRRATRSRRVGMVGGGEYNLNGARSHILTPLHPPPFSREVTITPCLMKQQRIDRYTSYKATSFFRHTDVSTYMSLFTTKEAVVAEHITTSIPSPCVLKRKKRKGKKQQLLARGKEKGRQGKAGQNQPLPLAPPLAMHKLAISTGEKTTTR